MQVPHAVNLYVPHHPVVPWSSHRFNVTGCQYLFTARCIIVQSAVLRLHVVCQSVCLSVCLSVALVDHDHISWKSRTLNARAISPTPSLFVAQRTTTYCKGNTEKFGGDYSWDRKKWRAGAQKRQYL